MGFRLDVSDGREERAGVKMSPRQSSRDALHFHMIWIYIWRKNISCLLSSGGLAIFFNG